MIKVYKDLLFFFLECKVDKYVKLYFCYLIKFFGNIEYIILIGFECVFIFIWKWGFVKNVKIN